MTAPKRRVIRVNAIAFAHLIKGLSHGDMTTAELAEVTGLNIGTVYAYCREMHRLKAVHICSYNPDARGRHNLKVYALGEKRDARRPRMSSADRQAKYRVKRRLAQMAQVTAGRGEFVKSGNGLMRYQQIEVAA